jgi:hypothetical protein
MVAIWLFTRLIIVAQVGFWNDVNGVQLQDVNTFAIWSDHLATERTMPSGDTWQYPPLTAFLMLVPRIGGDFGISFVVMMLLVDLLGLALLAVLGRREGRYLGVWVWLLGLPLLAAFPVLRFDLVPTVTAIAALLVVQRRPLWFGAIVGLGAMFKVWPAVLLLAEWHRGRLAKAVVAALAVVVLVFIAAAIAFGDQSGFFSNQGSRGLQVESVFSSPWHFRQIINGHGPHLVPRNGTLEVGTGLANTIASLLKWVTLVIGLGVVAWWLARDRAIRRGGREDLKDEAVGRDVVFTVVLLSVVVSRVLSPQFMIWLVGLAAVVLTSRNTRLTRAAWLVIAGVVLTSGLYQSPAVMLFRNLVLVAAAVDASIVMVRLVRRPAPAGTADEVADEPAPVAPHADAAAGLGPSAPADAPAG